MSTYSTGNNIFGGSYQSSQTQGSHPLVLSGHSKRFQPSQSSFGKENDSNDQYQSRPISKNQYKQPDSRRTLFPEYGVEETKPVSHKNVPTTEMARNFANYENNENYGHSKGDRYYEGTKNNQYDYGTRGNRPGALEDRGQNVYRDAPRYEESYGNYSKKQNYDTYETDNFYSRHHKNQRKSPVREEYRQERKSPIRQQSPVRRQQSPVKRHQSPIRKQKSPVRRQHREEPPKAEVPTHVSYKQKYDQMSAIGCLPGPFNSRNDPSYEQHFTRKIGPRQGEASRDIISGNRILGGQPYEEVQPQPPAIKALRNVESDNVFEAKDRVDPMTKHRQFSDNRSKLLAQSEDEFFVLKGHQPKSRPQTGASNVFKSSIQHLG